MGSAKHRSWSHTRGNLADTCLRALYYQYFPWGDPDQNLAWFLRRAANPDSLAGTIVHSFITTGLRQLLRVGEYPLGLDQPAIAEYEESLRVSQRIAESVRRGKRPPDEGTVLFHHLYGAEDPAAEERGRGVVKGALRAFEDSKALAFLKLTNFDRWRPLLTDTDDRPSFVAASDLGFSGAIGLRVYAAYDLALRWGDDLLIVDWKTGAKTPRSEVAAKRQLAVYTLWGVADGTPVERVRTLAYWLHDGEPWEPCAACPQDLRSVIETIEAHDAQERSMVTAVADKHGEIVKYEADRAAFKPQPERKKCGWCPYRSICSSGNLAVSPMMAA
ncbi:MAG TPA: PD-(D/E)XK nuclease family protein [Fimbriimonas sp.]